MPRVEHKAGVYFSSESCFGFDDDETVAAVCSHQATNHTGAIHLSLLPAHCAVCPIINTSKSTNMISQAICMMRWSGMMKEINYIHESDLRWR